MSLSTSGLLYCDTASPVFRFGVTQWSGSRLGRHQPAMAMSSVLWSRMLRTYAPHSPMIFTLVLIPFSVSWPATACAMSLSIAQRPLGACRVSVRFVCPAAASSSLAFLGSYS